MTSAIALMTLFLIIFMSIFAVAPLISPLDRARPISLMRVATALNSMVAAVLMAMVIFSVPYRGSVPALALAAALFLVFALGLGLFISTLTRNQFVAAQLAFLTTMMPSMMLSGRAK